MINVGGDNAMIKKILHNFPPRISYDPASSKSYFLKCMNFIFVQPLKGKSHPRRVHGVLEEEQRYSSIWC